MSEPDSTTRRLRLDRTGSEGSAHRRHALPLLFILAMLASVESAVADSPPADPPVAPTTMISTHRSLGVEDIASATLEIQASRVQMDPRGVADAIRLVLLVSAYFCIVWLAVGRNPPSTPIVVRYEPPVGLSPAMVGYLDSRGYAARQMTATMISLARQGVLEIDDSGRRWTLRRTGPVPADSSPDERSFVEKLLPDSDALVILGISRRRVREAKKALRRELRRRVGSPYFVSNHGWFGLGLLLSLVGIGAMAASHRSTLAGAAWILNPAVIFWGIVVARHLPRGYRAWRIDLVDMSPPPSLLAASVFPLVAGIAVLALGAMVFELSQALPTPFLVAVLALAAVNMVFYQLLERPTEAGRETLDHVEGFKRFLAATDTDMVRRLSMKRPDDLFQRHLPYAVALGLKNRWIAAFKDAASPG